MNKRKLGKTSMEISEIAFGGVEIGLPYGIGIQSEKDMLTENEAIDLLHASLDGGINFFDTARLYGNSETIMGKAFVGKRQNVILSTKCRHFRNKEGQLLPGSELKKFIEDSLHESLNALQTDYVDVFMLHQADEQILDNEIIIDTFYGIKKLGIARAIGASTYSIGETQKVIHSGVWDVIQLPFNLMDQRQQTFFDIAEQKGVGIIIRSVLLKGLLSDRGKALHPALKDVKNHIAQYNSLIDDDFPDLPSLALKFALSFPQVSSVLIGMDRMEYLYKSLAVADEQYMNKGKLQKALELAYPDPGFLNLPYWDRMGWLT